MKAEDFRRFGHELIDWIADYFEAIDQRPVLPDMEPGDLKTQLPSAPPVHGESMEEVTLDWLRQMMGLDPGMIGIIYDTASVSSMHAIAAAREGAEQRIREEGMSG